MGLFVACREEENAAAIATVAARSRCAAEAEAILKKNNLFDVLAVFKEKQKQQREAIEVILLHKP